MAPINDLAFKAIKAEKYNFASKILDLKDAIASFVGTRLSWKEPGEYISFHKGSFNIGYKIRRGESNEHVLIRFPAPATFEAWRDEKVINEAMVMQYLREHTSLPVPRVLDVGLGESSPGQIGPYIIMEFAEGCDLSDVLQQPTDDIFEPIVLDPNIDNAKLDFVYEQIAGFLLEISRLKFPAIGALSKDDVSGGWTVAKRPLTYDMNELATFGDMDPNKFATSPFSRSSEYFSALAKYLQEHLEAQKNITDGSDDYAWKLLVARRGFERLAKEYNTEADDAGPFRLFCDDLRPTNMLVDPETLRITAVLDFEFANAMPSQYIYDVPWWLLLQHPAELLGLGEKKNFLERFEPRKDQFIRALERVEARQPAAKPSGTLLSGRMRESWDSGRFWFNLMSRSSFDMDDIYWETLHTREVGEAVLNEIADDEKDRFLKKKQDQFNTYKQEKEKSLNNLD